MSIGKTLETCPRERNDNPMAVVVSKSSKSYSCDDGKKRDV